MVEPQYLNYRAPVPAPNPQNAASAAIAGAATHPISRMVNPVQAVLSDMLRVKNAEQARVAQAELDYQNRSRLILDNMAAQIQIERERYQRENQASQMQAQRREAGSAFLQRVLGSKGVVSTYTATPQKAIPGLAKIDLNSEEGRRWLATANFVTPEQQQLATKLLTGDKQNMQVLNPESVPAMQEGLLRAVGGDQDLAAQLWEEQVAENFFPNEGAALKHYRQTSQIRSFFGPTLREPSPARFSDPTVEDAARVGDVGDTTTEASMSILSTIFGEAGIESVVRELGFRDESNVEFMINQGGYQLRTYGTDEAGGTTHIWWETADGRQDGMTDALNRALGEAPESGVNAALGAVVETTGPLSPSERRKIGANLRSPTMQIGTRPDIRSIPVVTPGAPNEFGTTESISPSAESFTADGLLYFTGGS